MSKILAPTQVSAPVCLPAVVSSPKPCRIDPYTVSEDGHFVGMDGFIVPKDFGEFHALYPQYIKQWVRKQTRGYNVPVEVCEDFESELMIHMLTVPEDSIYRTPGTNGLPEGCTDRIQTFHPERSYGAGARRFFHFVNRCLLNQFIAMWKKRKNDPMSLTVDLQAIISAEDGEECGEDRMFGTCDLARRDDSHHNDIASVADEVYVRQFRNFILNSYPELLCIVTALSRHVNPADAQAELGWSERIFNRQKNRLRNLYECFRNSLEVPQHRRAYRTRITLLAA